MKKPVVILIVTLAVVAALAFLRRKAGEFDNAQHGRFQSALWQVKQLDTSFNQEVLKSRFALVDNYDDFQTSAAEMERSLEILRHPPSFVTPAGQAALHQALEHYQAVLEERKILFERFKTQNSMVSNSRRYLPEALEELSTRLATGSAFIEDNLALQTATADLSRLVLRRLAIPDDAPEYAPAKLQFLEDWCHAHPRHPDAQFAATLVRHAKIIVKGKGLVDSSTRELLALPSNATIQGIFGAYQTEVTQALGRSNQFRSMLYALSFITLFILAYAFWALRVANSNLEKRVRERTSALEEEVCRRVKAGEKLEESLLSLASINAMLDAACIIARTDQRGVITYANDNFCRISGYAREDLVGQSHRLLKSEDHPDSFFTDMWKTIAKGKMWRGEIKNLAKDGRPYWVDTTIGAVLDTQGKPKGYMAIRVDITQRKEFEMQLQRQQAELLALFDLIPASIWFKDTENNHLRVNKRVAESVGLSIAQIEGRPCSEIYPDDAAKFYADDLEVMRSGKPKLGYVESIRDAKGKLRWNQTDKVPYHDENGKLIGIVVMAQDITERKQAELALRQSEERFSEAFEHASIGMALVGTDGRWLKVNEALCELVGYTANELLTLTFENLTHPEDLQKGMDLMRQMMVGTCRTFQLEKRYLHKLGHPLVVMLSASLVRDDRGEPLHFIAQLQDITARKRSEAKLLESQRFLQSTLDALSAHIAILDETGHILAVNEVWKHFAESNAYTGGLFGVGTNYLKVCESATGKCATEATAVANGIRAVMANQTKGFQLEYPCHSPSEQRWFEVRITRFGNEVPVRVVVAHENITARKLADQKYLEAHTKLIALSRQAGMSEVATSVLHNVGNVLNSVNVSATVVANATRKSKLSNLHRVVALLEENSANLGAFFSSDAKGKQVPDYLRQLSEHLAGEQRKALTELDLLCKNIEHIKNIVSMQQNFTKVSGLLELAQVTELIEDALLMHVVALNRDQVKVVREFAPLPMQLVDRHKTLQILINLISNAKHACSTAERKPKQLLLRTAIEGDRVRVSIIDNGVGIAPENLVRIFSHGFTTKADGHGFGLHASANAAKEMGGSLIVQSEGLGKGATFTLELPLRQSERLEAMSPMVDKSLLAIHHQP